MSDTNTISQKELQSFRNGCCCGFMTILLLLMLFIEFTILSMTITFVYQTVENTTINTEETGLVMYNKTLANQNLNNLVYLISTKYIAYISDIVYFKFSIYILLIICIMFVTDC